MTSRAAAGLGQQLRVAVDDDTRSRRAAGHEPLFAGTRDPRPLLPAAAETLAGAVFRAATVALVAVFLAAAFVLAGALAVVFLAAAFVLAGALVVVFLAAAFVLAGALVAVALVAVFLAAAFVLAGALAALVRVADFFAAGAVTLVAGLVAAAGVPVRRVSRCASAAALTASPEAWSGGVGALTMAALLRPCSLRATRRDCLRASAIDGASPSAMASRGGDRLAGADLGQAAGQRLRVDLVRVEPAQLLGEALRELPPRAG